MGRDRGVESVGRVLQPLACALISGCLLAGDRHTARPAAVGTVRVGATIALTTYEYDDGNGGVARYTSPGLVPELSFRRGVRDDIDVGGRLGITQMAIQAGLTYRFHRTDRVHIAVAPAVGIQRLHAISGALFRLPVLATYELSDALAITGSAFAKVTRYGVGNPDEVDPLHLFSGAWLATGGSVGLAMSAGTFVVQPGLQIAHYGRHSGGLERAPFTATTIFVHVEVAIERRSEEASRPRDADGADDDDADDDGADADADADDGADADRGAP